MAHSIKALGRSVTNMITRAVVTGVNAAKKCQALQVELMADEPKDDVEHLEPYGFTSSPHLDAEAIALFPDGDRSHGIIIMVSDRRYRVTGLKNGEVCLYTDEGDMIKMKRGRTIEITTENYVVNTKTYVVNTTDFTLNAAMATLNASSKITLTTPTVSASADIKAANNISDGWGSMQSSRSIYNTHDHQYDDGTTGKPNQLMAAANDSDIERETD